MVYMIFDNPADKKDMSFLKNYGTASFIQLYPGTQCKSIKEMVSFCIDCINKSSDGDTVICWYDFMGVICWWLCKLSRKKINIIALNILLKDKNTKKNKIAKILYKKALKSEQLQATVTSKEYGEVINNILGINKNYTLLHDIYHAGYETSFSGNTVHNSVFCGGRNGRDWKYFFSLAAQMPSVQFNCVMPKAQYDLYKKKISGNINAKFDIELNEFETCMRESEFVVMPLDTQAPAGLITFFQAAAKDKLIITSDTVTTREYLSDGRGVLCKDSPNEWCTQIQYYLNHKEEVKTMTTKFKNFLKAKCSEKNYAETLEDMVSV